VSDWAPTARVRKRRGMEVMPASGQGAGHRPVAFIVLSQNELESGPGLEFD